MYHKSIMIFQWKPIPSSCSCSSINIDTLFPVFKSCCIAYLCSGHNLQQRTWINACVGVLRVYQTSSIPCPCSRTYLMYLNWILSTWKNLYSLQTANLSQIQHYAFLFFKWRKHSSLPRTKIRFACSSWWFNTYFYIVQNFPQTELLVWWRVKIPCSLPKSLCKTS